MDLNKPKPLFRETGKGSAKSHTLGAAARRAQASLLAVIFEPVTRQWLAKQLLPAKEGLGLHPGSGGGEGLFLLASLLGEKTTLYGIDEDAVLVEAARQEKARRGLEHVHFVQGNLTAWNGNRPFDFIYIRVEASAMPALEAWLAGISRNLKAAGELFVEVIKPSGFRAYPYNHALARAMDLIGRLEEAQPYEAEQLPGMLQQAGFSAIEVTYASPAFIPRTCNQATSLTLECYRSEILCCGDSTPGEFNALLQELQVFEQQEDTLVSRPGILQVSAKNKHT